MPEASQFKVRDMRLLTLANAISSGEIYQMPDGRAGFYPLATAVSGGGQVEMQLFGPVNVYKTTGVVFLDGQEVWWDHSANKTIATPGSDRDFIIGTAIGDADSTAITMFVDLNAKPNWYIDSGRDLMLHTPVGTANAPMIRQVGGWHRFTFSTATEAQKLDLFSYRKFSTESNWIAELEFMFVDDGDDAAIDCSFGVANETHADNADTIAQSCFIHTDGNSTTIYAESDDGDGTPVEVAATDTTKTYTLGTVTRATLDGRNHGDVQVYINDELVLGSTVFNLTDAVGPLGLLIHIEKSSNDTPLELYARGRVRTMEQ